MNVWIRGVRVDLGAGLRDEVVRQTVYTLGRWDDVISQVQLEFFPAMGDVRCKGVAALNSARRVVADRTAPDPVLAACAAIQALGRGLDRSVAATERLRRRRERHAHTAATAPTASDPRHTERARIAGGISEGLPVPASASVETATAVLARGAPGLDPSAEVRAPLAPASARRVGAALVPTGRRENGREDSQE